MVDFSIQGSNSMILRKLFWKEEVIVLFGPLLILQEGTPSLGQSIMATLTIAMNIKDPLLYVGKSVSKY